jgi:hypothetical protein
MTVMDSTEAQLRFGDAFSNLATESGLFPSGPYPGGQRGGGGEIREVAAFEVGIYGRSGKEEAMQI